MEKRGQITVFIIIGVMLILVVGFIALLNNSFSQRAVEPVTAATDPISSMIEGCLTDATKEAVRITFAQGGYDTLPSTVLTRQEFDSIVQVPYLFYEGEADIPSLSQIEKSVGRIAQDRLMECIDFSTFEKQGLVINHGSPVISIKFGAVNTRSTLDFPLRISRENDLVNSEFISITELEHFSISLPLPFSLTYDAIFGFLSLQEQDDDFLIGDLSDAADSTDAILYFNQYGDLGEQIVVEWGATDSEEPLLFTFGLNFGWNDDLVSDAKGVDGESSKGLAGDGAVNDAGTNFGAGGVSDAEAREDILDYSYLVGDESVVSNNIYFAPTLEEIYWEVNKEGRQDISMRSTGNNLNYELDTKFLAVDELGRISFNTEQFPNDEYLYYGKVVDALGEFAIAPIYLDINIPREGYPVIAPIDRQSAIVGKRFLVSIKAENADSYLVSSDMVNIDNKGVITFLPNYNDVGTHQIRVDAINDKGSTWTYFELEVR
jgi:hypothetical protein